MDNLRIFATTLIVIIIALLSIFQMQLRGYTKIARIEEWVLYVDSQEACTSIEELIHSDAEYRYYITCISIDNYIIKKGFEEKGLQEGLKDESIGIKDLELLIDIIKKDRQ